MRNRTIQAMSIGLSAVLLSGPVSLTAYAAEVEIPTDTEDSVKEQEADASDEMEVAEDVSNLSEQLNNSGVSENLKDSASDAALENQYQQQVDEISQDESVAIDAVDSTCTSTENVVKASEAIDTAVEQVDQAASDADDAIGTMQDTVSQAADDAQNAVFVISDNATTKDDAQLLIADTSKTVEDATTAFDSATEKYDQALADYESAKDDYDTALKAYNSNMTDAKSDMDSANSSLEAIQAKLQELEKQLAQARTELAEAGADALIAAEDNKAPDTAKYVEVVLQNYYIPSTEELEDGQKISNFTSVASEDGAEYIHVSYDIVDSEGKVLRTINADYGYEIDSNSGQIQLYTRELTYQYNDSNGNPVVLAKDQAEKLNNTVVIGKETYIPLFKLDGKYEGARPIEKASRKASIAQGKEYVKNRYTPDREEYKVDVQFNDDWDASLRLLGLQWVTEGTYTATVYSRLDEKFSNTGSPLWMDDSKDYTSYISNVRAKVTAYDNLIKSVTDARTQYKDASNKVADIQKRLESLEQGGTLISATNMVRLEMQLNSAKETYSMAKDNLTKAKNALAEAKDIFTSRFPALAKPQGQTQSQNDSVEVQEFYPVSQLIALEDVIEEELVEEPNTLPIIQTNGTVHASVQDTNSENTVGGISAAGSQSLDDASEVESKIDTPPTEVIQIPEDETPLGITLSGIMERGKWFIGLAGVSVAAGGVAILEVKRHAAAKIIDKLNQ